jgi:hypothetical protein
MLRSIQLLGALVLGTAACAGCKARITSGETDASAVVVRVTPVSAHALPGGSQQFIASVTGTSTPAVTWDLADGATLGTISSSGVYFAPEGAATTTLRISATSTADTNVKGYATVYVSNTLPPAPTKARYVGGSMPEISNWTPPVYANALGQADPWTDFSGTRLDNSGRLDSSGNPTVDARIMFVAGSGPGPSAVIAGTYKLSFNGQADLNVDGATISNKTYNASANVTTADVNVPSSGPNYQLELTNTWRNAAHTADATGNTRGVTNVRLMYPGHSWPADYFRKEVMAMNSVFSLIRFSSALGPSGGSYSCNNGVSGVMGSCNTAWSTRARPGFYGYSASGMPWEDTVIFANLSGLDVWINIPINADNDYVTKLFQLLKYGSDGNLPFTSGTHDPAAWTPGVGWYPGLLPGRKVYVEFTNELFTYYDYGDPQARAEVSAGDPHHLNFDGIIPGYGGGDRWNMWNVVRISLLGRQVWGDAAMQDTVRIVYAGQGDWGDWGRHQYGMDYLTAVWGPSSSYATIGGFTNPKKPASYYIHNVSGSFYLRVLTSSGTPDGTPTATTVGSVGTLGVRSDGSGVLQQLKWSLSCDGGLKDWAAATSIYQRHLWGEAMAARYGIKYTAYETGMEVFNLGSVSGAWSNPGMTTIYYWLLRHMMDQPHADVAIESATVRGVYPGNELSMSYAASAGFPWPLSGASSPSPEWQAVINLAGGQ